MKNKLVDTFYHDDTAIIIRGFLLTGNRQKRVQSLDYESYLLTSTSSQSLTYRNGELLAENHTIHYPPCPPPRNYTSVHALTGITSSTPCVKGRHNFTFNITSATLTSETQNYVDRSNSPTALATAARTHQTIVVMVTVTKGTMTSCDRLVVIRFRPTV